MISCDRCGFGHKTFEEKAACKSWSEMQALVDTTCCAGCGHLLTESESEYYENRRHMDRLCKPCVLEGRA